MFLRPNGEDDGQFLAAGSWERVRQVLGGLMEPLGLYPERYRLRSFPTAGQLADIGICRLWFTPPEGGNVAAA